MRSGELPVCRPPGHSELDQVLARTGLGRGDASVYNLGCSKQGENCLALWSQGNGDMMGRAITSFLALMHIENYELVRIKCHKTLLAKAGIWLAKVPGLKDVGLSLVYRHVVNIYRELGAKY